MEETREPGDKHDYFKSLDRNSAPLSHWINTGLPLSHRLTFSRKNTSSELLEGQRQTSQSYCRTIALPAPTRYPYYMMFVAFNNNTTSTTSGTGADSPSGPLEFPWSLVGFILLNL